MLKKNKRIAAFLTAVLVLSLTVFGSLTVSAEDSTETVTLSNDVEFSLVPSGTQLTAEVYSWDSNCTGLFFTVDGVKVGSNFMVSIVGPVSKHVGTLADCDALTSGYHKIGVCQTNSEGAVKYSSSSTYFYFTHTSSGYILGSTSTLGTTVPTELASITKQTTSVTYVPTSGSICFDFEYDNQYYFCSHKNSGNSTSPIQLYTLDTSTYQITKTVNLYWSKPSYSYASFADIFYYDGCLYVYGVCYGSNSTYTNYSYSLLYRVPMYTIADASDGGSINIYNYSYGSGLPSSYLKSNARRTYIRSDGTYFHILVNDATSSPVIYYRYNISAGSYETYSTPITSIDDFQYENGYAYFCSAYTDTTTNKTIKQLCSFNFATREYTVLATIPAGYFNHIASSLATSSVTDAYGASVPAAHVTLSSFVRIGDGKYLCGYSVVSAPYRYNSSHNGTTTSDVGSGTLFYTLSDNKITKVLDSNIGTVYRAKYFLAIGGTSSIYKYTPFAVTRYYTEAEYQAALAAGTCDKTHVTDTNSDGYDDASYTAGYNSGLSNSPKTPSLSYRDGKLLWTRTNASNPVYLEYMTYTDYGAGDDYATWTPLVVGMDYSYDYWETDEYDWHYEKTHNNKWVQFRLVESIGNEDVYSNIIQIDVCLTSHVVDTNSDGYDDSSYTAGYNAGGGACSLIHVVDNDNDTYDDTSFTAGKQAGITYQKNVTTDSGVSDFVTKILGAFTGSALYVGSNISIGGITLLTIVGIIAIGGAVIIVLKVLKGG